MRILFISSNRERRVMPPMPLGLASVTAQVDESWHRIQVLDLMFSESPEDDLKSALSEFGPDLIAISVRNIDNQSYLHTQFLLPRDRSIIDLCRSDSDAVIVVGGPAITVSPLAIFAYLRPDFGVAGEGEVVFPLLVDRISRNADCTDLPGLVWQDAGKVRMNPPSFIEDLDSLKRPRRELFDNQRYAQKRSFGNIVIKQGCAFRCLYCDSPQTMGPKWRMRSPQKVVDELDSMQSELGIEMAYFTDAIFNCPTEHAEAICRTIIRRGLKMNWIATLHPAFTQRRLVELMRDAGCVAVSVSCDACSEKMLEVLQKGFTKAQLQAATDLLEEMEINYFLSLLIGGPGENRQTVEEAVDFVTQRNPMMLDFCVGIRLMPRTALFDIAVKEGVIEADDPLMEPKFYISPEVEGWVEDYLMGICADRKNWSVSHVQP